MGSPTLLSAPSRARPVHGSPRRLARIVLCAAALVGLLAAWPATAINGFFLPGYGAKLIGVAGTGVAMPQDRMVGAVNPAGMALVAPGFDASALQRVVAEEQRLRNQQGGLHTQITMLQQDQTRDEAEIETLRMQQTALVQAQSQRQQKVVPHQ